MIRDTNDNDARKGNESASGGCKASGGKVCQDFQSEPSGSKSNRVKNNSS